MSNHRLSRSLSALGIIGLLVGLAGAVFSLASLQDRRSELGCSGAGLKSLQSDLQPMRQAVRSAELPRLAVGAGVFGGELYVFLVFSRSRWHEFKGDGNSG